MPDTTDLAALARAKLVDTLHICFGDVLEPIAAAEIADAIIEAAVERVKADRARSFAAALLGDEPRPEPVFPYKRASDQSTYDKAAVLDRLGRDVDGLQRAIDRVRADMGLDRDASSPQPEPEPEPEPVQAAAHNVAVIILDQKPDQTPPNCIFVDLSGLGCGACDDQPAEAFQEATPSFAYYPTSAPKIQIRRNSIKSSSFSSMIINCTNNVVYKIIGHK